MIKYAKLNFSKKFMIFSYFLDFFTQHIFESRGKQVFRET